MEKKSEKALLWSAVILGILSLVGIVITFVVYAKQGLIYPTWKTNTNHFGILGDFIGGIFGTLLSISTVILVWLTYNSQKKEFQVISATAKRQNFETTLFNLFNNLDLIKKDIKFDRESFPIERTFRIEPYIGFECIATLTNQIGQIRSRFLQFEVTNPLFYDHMQSKITGSFNAYRELHKDLSTLELEKKMLDIILKNCGKRMGQYINLIKIIARTIKRNASEDRETNDLYKRLFMVNLNFREFELLRYYAENDLEISKIIEDYKDETKKELI
jgi:hypothetical protein